MLVDTHAHIHSKFYELNPLKALADANTAGVEKILCVGTEASDSERAVSFVADKSNCWATIGQHPHDAKMGTPALKKLKQLVGKSKVVAIGECGLDYYYLHSQKDVQQQVFRAQIELAIQHNLPLIFHVREAFDDFFKILDEYSDVRGVVHSFTADRKTLYKILERDLFVGLNGIMTFTKDAEQLAAARAVPLERLVLETDAPFLTPTPLRGKINEPANIKIIAEFLANLRGEKLTDLAAATSNSSIELFNL